MIKEDKISRNLLIRKIYYHSVNQFTICQSALYQLLYSTTKQFLLARKFIFPERVIRLLKPLSMEICGNTYQLFVNTI